MKTLERISLPVWAAACEVRNDGIGGEMAQALQSARTRLLSAVDAHVAQYLTSPALVFEECDAFPSSQRLTGQYYVAGEHRWRDPETGVYRINVQVHCLAHPLMFQQRPDDYLGLDLWFETTANCEAFYAYRNTDSSVI